MNLTILGDRIYHNKRGVNQKQYSKEDKKWQNLIKCYEIKHYRKKLKSSSKKINIQRKRFERLC
jgi:hypothetical protein